MADLNASPLATLEVFLEGCPVCVTRHPNQPTSVVRLATGSYQAWYSCPCGATWWTGWAIPDDEVLDEVHGRRGVSA